MALRGCYCPTGPQLFDRDEVQRLADLLNVSELESGAHVALLISFAIQRGEDDGDISSYSCREIEKYCRWYGDLRGLIRAALTANVLVGDLDREELKIAPALWNEFARAAITNRIAARARKQNERKTKQNQQTH